MPSDEELKAKRLSMIAKVRKQKSDLEQLVKVTPAVSSTVAGESAVSDVIPMSSSSAPNPPTSAPVLSWFMNNSSSDKISCRDPRRAASASGVAGTRYLPPSSHLPSIAAASDASAAALSKTTSCVCVH